MSLMAALEVGLLTLLLLSIGRNSSAEPVVMATSPVAETRRGADRPTRLLTLILLLLFLLEVLTSGG